MGAWRRLRRNIGSWAELQLLLQMTGFLALVPALLKLPMPRMLRTIDWINRHIIRRPGRQETVIRYANALGRLHRWSFQDNCVARNLTYYAFLNGAERPLEVRFGVEQRRAENGAITPGRRHVWVTRDGEPINETVVIEDYVLLYRYPPKAQT
jgi:hypothetical protein